jgi:hypothetical protein
MPRPVQMSTLVLRAQQLADMEGDDSIDTTEWNALISEAYGEAYEIVAGEGNRYFEYTTTLTTDGTNYLPEPDDQLAIVDQLELILDATTGRCRRLHPITPQQRAALTGRTGQPRFYELVDGRYFMYPTPPAGQQLTLRYVAQCPDLTAYAGDDQADCYCVAGQKFVQYAAAAAAVSKSKNDASALLAEREVQRKLLWEWAADRAMNAQPVWYVEDGGGEDWLPSSWSW